MQQDEMIRHLLADAADDIGPAPDLTAQAVRAGKRSLLMARVRLGAVSAVAAAAVLTPAVVVAPWWNDAADPAAAYEANMPLYPAAWPLDSPLEAPTTAFPVVPGDPGVDPPEVGTDQRQVQYAFKQKAAEIFAALLPPGSGRLEIVDNALNAYRVTSAQGSLDLIFMGSAIAPGVDRETSYGSTCPPVDGVKIRTGDCVSGTTADGTGIVVRRGGGYSPDGASTGPAVYSAHFIRGDFLFTLDITAAVRNPAPAAPTAEQLLDIAEHPDVTRLADFWAKYPALMDEGYEHHVVTVAPSGATFDYLPPSAQP